MQQQTLSLLQFQKKFGAEKACRSFLEGQITKESKQYHSSGGVEDFYE
jgi:hypothetical protein